VIHPNGITLRNQHNMSTSKLQSQRGSTLLGFILGLVIGLTVALGVAMYVTKVPMPFSNKNQSRSAEQDAVESQKNKDWNPNGALQSKPATAETPADSSAAPASNAPAPAVAADPLADLMKKSSSGSAPASPAASAPAVAPPPAATPQPAPAPAASPATTPAANKAAANDPFTYFVQAGAFKSASDADAQKAKLSMMGIESKVSERDQAGRTIYRVRSGPFDDKEQAEKIKARLDATGIDAALVRVQR
jgi:cell division protein FtsN